MNLVQDLRFALRMLAKNPAYTAAAVVTLALGLGANIAIFTVVHSVVLAPLPYESPEELARVYGTRTSQGIEQAGLSEADFYDFRERLKSIDLQMYHWHGLSLSDSERPRELATIQTSAGLLDLLGVSPLKGRTFLPEEEVDGNHLAESTAQRRFYTALIGLFATLALVLAAVGLYGVISYSVSQRTQEIGIRMTLGARSWDLQSLVLLRGALLVAAGVLLGLLGGTAVARGISSFLYGVSALDPATFGWVLAGLAAVALVACWLPARRAARLDPVRALREG